VDTLLSSSAHAARTSMPELHLSSCMLVPAAAQISIGGLRLAHLHQPIKGRNWRPVGEVCSQRIAMTAEIQGARVAGFGDYDVTDTKFSNRLGPPSCSPPV
jgi:hypothetical protein